MKDHMSIAPSGHYVTTYANNDDFKVSLTTIRKRFCDHFLPIISEFVAFKGRGIKKGIFVTFTELLFRWLYYSYRTRAIITRS